MANRLGCRSPRSKSGNSADQCACGRSTFAALILRPRRELGLNQTGLAAALGVPANTMRVWGRGKSLPCAKRRETMVRRIAELRTLSSQIPPD